MSRSIQKALRLVAVMAAILTPSVIGCFGSDSEFVIPFLIRSEPEVTSWECELFSGVSLEREELINCTWDKDESFNPNDAWDFFHLPSVETLGDFSLVVRALQAVGLNPYRALSVGITLYARGGATAFIEPGTITPVTASVNYPITGTISYGQDSKAENLYRLTFTCRPDAGHSVTVHETQVLGPKIGGSIGAEFGVKTDLESPIGFCGFELPMPSSKAGGYETWELTAEQEKELFGGITGFIRDAVLPQTRGIQDESSSVTLKSSADYVGLKIDIDEFILALYGARRQKKIEEGQSAPPPLPSGLSYSLDLCGLANLDIVLADGDINPSIAVGRDVTFTPNVEVTYFFEPDVMINGVITGSHTVSGSPGENLVVDVELVNGSSVTVSPSVRAAHSLTCALGIDATVDGSMEAVRATTHINTMRIWDSWEVGIPIPYPCGDWWCPICEWCIHNEGVTVPAFEIPGFSFPAVGPLMTHKEDKHQISILRESHSTELSGTSVRLPILTLVPCSDLATATVVSVRDDQDEPIEHEGIEFLTSGDGVEIEVTARSGGELDSVIAELNGVPLDVNENGKARVSVSELTDGPLQVEVWVASTGAPGKFEPLPVIGPTLFVDKTEPNPPSGLAPTGIVNDNPLSLSWMRALDADGGSGVVGYEIETRIQEWNEEHEGPPVRGSETKTTSNPEIELEDNFANGMYDVFWSVRASDLLGQWSDWSEESLLTVDTVLPRRPDDLNPELAFAPAGGVSLSWKRSSDSSGIAVYQVEINCPESGETEILETAELNLAPGGLLQNCWNAFTWRVRAVDMAGNVGEFSDNATIFRIDQSPALQARQPTLKSPENGEHFNANTVPTELHWTGGQVTSWGGYVVNCEDYEVEIFGTHYVSVTVRNATSLLIPNDVIPTDGQVEWRVRGRKDGYLGAYSDMQSFHIDTIEPQVARLSSGLGDGSSKDYFLVAVHFSEAMIADGSADPIVTLGATGTWSPTSGEWHGEDTYVAAFDLAGREIPGIGTAVQIEGAMDEAANLLSPSLTLMELPEQDFSPPAAPERLSPSSGTITRIRPTPLAWTPADDGTGAGIDLYEVEIVDYDAWANATGFGHSYAESWNRLDSHRVQVIEQTYDYADPATETEEEAEYGICWRVRARDRFGQWGAWSEASLLIVDTVPPSKPAGMSPMTAYAPPGELCLMWEPAHDSNGIEKYRVEIDGQDTVLCTEGLEIFETDEPGFMTEGCWYVFTWRVRAVDKAGNVGDYSDHALIYRMNQENLTDAPEGSRVPTLLAPPDGAVFDEGSPTIILEWEGGKVTGPRSVSPSQMEVLDSQQYVVEVFGAGARFFVVDETSFELPHSAIPATGKVEWRVRTHKPDENGDVWYYSAYSEKRSLTVETDDTVPGEIETVTASDSLVNRIDVSWSSAVNAASYDVWAADNPFFAEEYFIGTVEESAFSDEEVGAGRSRWYRVQACNDTACAQFSDIVEGRRLVPAPTGITAHCSLTGVEIQWEPVPNTDFYVLYRASTEDGVYAELTTVIGNARQYLDETARIGDVSWYGVRALTNGSLSELSNVAAGQRVAEAIAFADENLEAAVRDAIGQPEGEISICDVAQLESLDASNRGITDLGGIENLSLLGSLNLTSNSITDISPLSGLTYLYNLRLTGNPDLSDISALSALTALRNLYMHYCHSISDISPLSGLPDLRTIFVTSCPISDISVLLGLPKLKRAFLKGIPLGAAACADIAALKARGVNVTHSLDCEVAPHLIAVALSTSNPTGEYVKPGDRVTVTFEVDTPLSCCPRVSLSRCARVSASYLGSNVWEAVFASLPDDCGEGVLEFEIEMDSKSGSEATVETSGPPELILDVSPPVISGCPDDITELSNQLPQCEVYWDEPAADDYYSGLKSFTSTHSPGDKFPAQSATTVTYTAVDHAGNESTCSFTVTVN